MSQGDEKLAAERPHIALSEKPAFKRQTAGIPCQSMRMNGHLVNFSDIKEVYGAEYCGRLLDAFATKYFTAAPNTTQRRVNLLRKAHTFLAAMAFERGSGPFLDVLNDLRASRQPSREHWGNFIDDFSEALRNTSDLRVVQSASILTRREVLDVASMTFRDLSDEGLWPDVGPIAGLRVGRVSGGNIPALGELNPEGLVAKGAYEAVQNRNRDRLVRLRELMERVLLEELDRFERCQAAVSASSPTLEDLESALAGWRPPRQFKRIRSTDAALRLFPADDYDVRLASILRLVHLRYPEITKVKAYPYKLECLINSVGGLHRVRECREGTLRAAIAAWTLVAIDSGLNVSPIDDLAADPFTGGAKRGHMALLTVTEIKKRANYAPVDGHLVEDELPALPLKVAGTRVSGAEAIRIWKKMSAPARADACDEVAECLWIVRRRQEAEHIRKITAYDWRDAWNQLLREFRTDPIIGGLPIQRRMIRTTWIQLRDLDSHSDARIVAKLAGHSSPATTKRHYLNRRFIRLRLDELVREFQNLLEAGIATGSPRLANALGITDAQLEVRRERAIETGLGFQCEDPLAGVQKGAAGSACTRLDACSRCPMLRFQPSEQSLRDLIWFRRSLEAAQVEFYARNPERWVEVWLPQLALTIAAEELVSNSPMQALLSDLLARTEDRPLFKPW